MCIPVNRSNTRRLDAYAHHEFLFGGLAYTVSVLSLFPVYKTVFFQQLDGVSWPVAFARLRSEGPRLAYRGVLPPLLQRASSGAVMFGVQSLTERTLCRHPRTAHLSHSWHKTFGAVVAGVCEAPLMPFERVQTLLQNTTRFPTYRNTFHTLTSLVLTHGVAELYRGLGPVLIRNCTANVFYFTGHKWLSDWRHHGANEGPLERGAWNFILGGLLGGAIGLLTFPLNVVKTRMQSTVGGSFVGMRATFIELVYQNGQRMDITRLYRGSPANFMRAILSWGIITMTYHCLLEFQLARPTHDC